MRIGTIFPRTRVTQVRNDTGSRKPILSTSISIAKTDSIVHTYNKIVGAFRRLRLVDACSRNILFCVYNRFLFRSRSEISSVGHLHVSHEIKRATLKQNSEKRSTPSMILRTGNTLASPERVALYFENNRSLFRGSTVFRYKCTTKASSDEVQMRILTFFWVTLIAYILI